jgi:hypothetical protein
MLWFGRPVVRFHTEIAGNTIFCQGLSTPGLPPLVEPVFCADQQPLTISMARSMAIVED